MRKPRIFLADDHAMLLDAFRRLLEQEFDIVGTASDGLELLDSAPSLQPELVVIDLWLAPAEWLRCWPRAQKAITPDKDLGGYGQ